MKKSSYKFPLIMLSSVILGIILGFILKGNVKYIKPFGDIFINMMYTIVVPLVFFTISSAIAKMTNFKRLSKILRYVLGTFIVTSLISCVIALIVVLNVDLIGNSKIILDNSASSESASFLTQVVNAVTVNDFVNLFSRSNILPLIIFSSIFGIALGLTREKSERIILGLQSMSDVMLKIISIIMYYAPIGICAYFASLVGEFGMQIIGSYTKTLIIYFLLAIFYYIVIYSIYSYIAGGVNGVKLFFKKSIYSCITALATQSSLASLPTNIEVSREMNISDDISDIALPLGSTIHMEGSCIGAIFKIFFLFAVFNIDITFGNCIVAIVIAVLSGIVMSGIPGGGMIGEMLIINLYGFSASAFPLIATIGWLIDAPATMLNVVGDISSSMLVSRFVDNNKFEERA